MKDEEQTKNINLVAMIVVRWVFFRQPANENNWLKWIAIDQTKKHNAQGLEKQMLPFDCKSE